MPTVERTNCCDCGRSTETWVVNNQTQGDVCLLCAEVNLFISSVDGRYYPRMLRVRSDNGELMTQQQLDDYESYEQCDHCNSNTLRDELSSVTNGDTEEEVRVCNSCYEENCSECQHSGCETMVIGRMSEALNGRNNEVYFCSECHSDYTSECYDCDVSITLSPSLHHDPSGERYCRSCYPNNNVRIHNYSWSPSETVFQGTDDWREGKFHKRGQAFYGVELEIDTPHHSHTDVANNCPLLSNERFVYCKEDSSTDGFEVITQPMSFDAQKKFGWRNVLEQLHSNGARGYDSGNCGIHVHVTKESYSPLTWWKVLEFSYTCQSYLKMFAQRNGNYNYCKYKPADYYRGYDNKKNTYPSNPRERYVHINFPSNHPTGEFRMFRATTKMDRFWASIEFVYSLVSFCENHGYAYIKVNSCDTLWSEFLTFIQEQNQCKTLLSHLKGRNLTPRQLCV